MKEDVSVLIIGSGPAGYTAAIYVARAGLLPVLYKGKQPGGQLSITSDVENYPGFSEGILGPQMMEIFEKQAQRFRSDIREGFITEVDLFRYPFYAKDDHGRSLLSQSIIISTGASAKWLGIKGETRLGGKGVSACAVCDGFFFKNQRVGVVGGGDSACEEALYLSKLAKKVYIFVRKGGMRASHIMQNRVKKASNIEIMFHHKPIEVIGEEKVEGVLLENTSTGARKELALEGFFVAIGHHPNSDLFANQLTRDEQGYIITLPDSTKTNISGVFATGDVQDKHYRQAVTAAASGCMGALEAERFLQEKKDK